MEDEIDLRQYIHVLIRHWKLIVSLTLIAVIAAVVVGFVSPPTYEVEASVLITVTRAEISFEPKYKTSSSQERVEIQKALVALVKSDSVAAGVVTALGDRLKTGEQSVTRLQKKVGVESEGDLIKISVKSPDPEKAADIANAWAESYESYVNGLYMGSVQSPEEVQDQADEAKKDYEEKQGEWESFVSSSRLDELNQLIADKKLLVDIKSLREQIAAGSSSASSAAANSLAIILLQSQAFTTLPAELQVSLDALPGVDVGTEEQLHDVDALIATLESRTAGQPGQPVGELREEILQLKGERERESAQSKELKRVRDVAWQTYTTLDNKAVELRVASQAQDVAVRVAAPAAVPELVAARPGVTTVGVALVLGLIVGVFGAFGVEYFRNTGGKPEKEDEGQVKGKAEAGKNG